MDVLDGNCECLEKVESAMWFFQQMRKRTHYNGEVTKDRTTVIKCDFKMYSTGEKCGMGNVDCVQYEGQVGARCPTNWHNGWTSWMIRSATHLQYTCFSQFDLPEWTVDWRIRIDMVANWLWKNCKRVWCCTRSESASKFGIEKKKFGWIVHVCDRLKNVRMYMQLCIYVHVRNLWPWSLFQHMLILLILRGSNEWRPCCPQQRKMTVHVRQ